jgi:putative flippase GtrA
MNSLPSITRIEQLLWAAPGEGMIGQLVRYGIVAGSGYLLAIACYSGELAIGIAPYVGLGIAFVLNGLYNFALVRLWAFPPSGRGVRSDISRFCLVATLSLVVNYGSFAVLYSLFGLPASTAQRIAILIAAPVTFLANRFWSFRSARSTRMRESDQDEDQGEGALETSARKESYSRM